MSNVEFKVTLFHTFMMNQYTMKEKIKIGGATLNQIPIHWEHNTSNIIRAIQVAREQAVDILCLPELCLTGYGCEDLFLMEWVTNRAWEELKKILPHIRHITVCLGLPMRINKSIYNGVAVLQNHTVCGITLKQNMARDGVHYEPRWFVPWPSGIVKQIEKEGLKIDVGDLMYHHKDLPFGIEICEDAWGYERPAKKFFQQKAALIVNPSASHFALGKSALREKMVKESSAQYHCAYVYVNLLGNEAGRIFYDGDILIAHKGSLFVRNRRLSFQSFMVQSCEIDLNSCSIESKTLSDENIDRNEEYTQALSLGLFDYLRKSEAKGFALSLSGGADSACCAVMIAEMVKRASAELGWDTFAKILRLSAVNVKTAMRELLICAYQSSRYSSEKTFASAQAIAESTGATFYTWSIDTEVVSYTDKVEKALGRPLTWDSDDHALQNIQARARSPIIWLLANVANCILITTSNRSEGDVGYTTMDGDTSGSLAPLAGIDKPFILQWLKWAQNTLSYKGLHIVNTLPPTAELKPLGQDQTDEKELMPYPLLRAIEELAIQEGKSPNEIYKILSAQYDNPESVKNAVQKFFKLWALNQWKRERIAPSFHLDKFNIDPRSGYRFPILSSRFRNELTQLE